MEGAQEVIEQFSNSNGSWPFYADGTFPVRVRAILPPESR